MRSLLALKGEIVGLHSGKREAALLEWQPRYRIVVVGSRSFNDYVTFSRILEALIDRIGKVAEVSLVSGGVRGADAMADRFAEERGLPIEVFPADWDRYGKRAGFVRDETIWGKSDFGIAFWDGESRGTKHSFELARKRKKVLVAYRYSDGAFLFEDGEPINPKPSLF